MHGERRDLPGPRKLPALAQHYVRLVRENRILRNPLIRYAAQFCFFWSHIEFFQTNFQ